MARHLTQDPSRLWIWDETAYKDGEQRVWVPLIYQKDNVRHMLLRQQDIPLGKAMSPTQLSHSHLPLMWQLYDNRIYRCSDSSLWRVVYHIEFCGIEDLLLEHVPNLKWP
ncbi:T-cell leukemia/lymphoma protein 1A [Ctenodactylus gundi]